MSQAFDVTITVSFQNGIPSSSPNPATIADVDTSGTVDITWVPSGCTINSIVWTTPGAPQNPTQDGGGPNWSVSYAAPTTPVNWNYTVSATEDGAPNPISHDPEVDNIKP
jgi:hypothetical protein